MPSDLRSDSTPAAQVVGYYKPDGSREPESDHDSPDKAAAQAHYLNGGCQHQAVTADLVAALEPFIDLQVLHFGICRYWGDTNPASCSCRMRELRDRAQAAINAAKGQVS